MKLLSIAILLISSLPALAQFGAQAVSAGRWEPRNYTNSLGLQLSYCTYWTNGLTLNGSGVSAWTNRLENSFNLAQGTAASQPTLSRSDNKANLLVQSETFETTWYKSQLNAFQAISDTGSEGEGSRANTGRTTDPIGGNSADFLQENSGSQIRYISQGPITLVAGRYTVSVWIKPVNRLWAFIQLFNASGGLRQAFNLSTLTLGSHPNEGTAVWESASIVENPTSSGWLLCTFTGTLPAGSSTYVIRMGVSDDWSAYTGDNTSGIFIYGASLRPASCDSDYIATTATPAYPGLAAGGTYKPVLVFDGSNDSMSVACEAMVQPTVVIWGGRQVTWTSTDVLFDGTGASAGVMAVRQAGTTPQLRPYAGTTTDSVLNDELALGDWGVGSFVFDGATSWNQIDKGAIKAGDIGSNDGTGLTLARNATGTAASNIEVFGVLVMANTNLSAIAYARLGFLGMANTK